MGDTTLVSGPISFSDVTNILGRGDEKSMSEFYSIAKNVPSIGSISMSDLYNKKKAVFSQEVGKFGMAPWNSSSAFIQPDANWVWKTVNANLSALSETVTFEAHFFNNTNNVIDNVELHVICDNVVNVYLNDVLLGVSPDRTWTTTTYPKYKNLSINTGNNTLKFIAANSGGPAGLLWALVSTDETGALVNTYAMSDYKTQVLPTNEYMWLPPASMRANTSTITGVKGAGTYIASMSDPSPNEPPYFAFDGNIDSFPHATNFTYEPSTGNYTGDQITTCKTPTGSFVDLAGAWLQLQMPVPILLTQYKIKTRAIYIQRMPAELAVVGSMDGSNWDLLDLRTTHAWSDMEERIFTVTTRPTSYTIFRIVIIRQQPGDNGVFNPTVVSFYGGLTL